MHGNVWEWVHDAYHDSYDGSPTDGSAWEGGGDASRKVLKGGSWFSYPENIRFANKIRAHYMWVSDQFGFRIAKIVRSDP
jgi:formylglycine-generating enzyme required for sulfatase activity